VSDRSVFEARSGDRPWHAMFLYRGSSDISRSESVMLDFVRSLAALTVFVSHWASGIVTGDTSRHGFIEGLGFPGVLVFFVLSGYVISWASQTRETSARSYIVARAARLYSVVVPVLLLLFVVEFGLKFFVPSIATVVTGNTLAQVLVSLFFANKWWFAASAPFSDAPYWSLSFEAAYYALWGFFVYGKAYRWILLTAGALVVGPKILLLFPLWLFGAALHRSRLRLTRVGAVALLPVALILIALGKERLLLPLNLWEMAAPFLSHWIRAAGVCVGLACAMALSPFGNKGGAIKWFAERSFTLYLLHYPALLLLAHYFPDLRATLSGRILIGGLALAICVALGGWIEPTKSLWKRWFNALADRIHGALYSDRVEPLTEARSRDGT
jgi:peptidoglycan/LPS O-acetylase OafA/YrhL